MDINITHFVMFLVGALLGTVGCLLVTRQSTPDDTVETKLRNLQDEFTAYRENVNQHFNQTTQLVNELTTNYAKVQEHLGEAAQSFAKAPKSFDLENSDKAVAKVEPLLKLETKGKANPTDAQFDDPVLAQQPKDYAPKKPEQKGTLTEDFGLHS